MKINSKYVLNDGYPITNYKKTVWSIKYKVDELVGNIKLCDE
jgi:hypothetical protein